MPKKVSLLPMGTTLTPGTSVEIFHSDTINHIVYETAPVCDDGVSVRSSLNPKQLEKCVRTFWKVCVTNPSGIKVQYCDQVRTEDVVAGKSIRLCSKKAAQLMGMFYGTYARTYKSDEYYTKFVRKTPLVENPIPNNSSDNDGDKTNTTQCLEDFLKSELQYIPCWYSDTSRPCPSDFSALLNFITSPQEEEASTSTAVRKKSRLERIIETETTETND